MARDDLHFRLRIPDDLKQRVEAAAGASHRSMTAEIIFRLERTFANDDYNAEVEDRLARGEPPFDDIPQPESMDDYGHVRAANTDKPEVEIDGDMLQRLIVSAVRSAMSDVLGLASSTGNKADEMLGSIEQILARSRDAGDQISKVIDKEYPPFKPRIVKASVNEKAGPSKRTTPSRSKRATGKR